MQPVLMPLSIKNKQKNESEENFLFYLKKIISNTEINLM